MVAKNWMAESEFNSISITTNFTVICFVYKGKIVISVCKGKIDKIRRIKIQGAALFYPVLN